MDNAPAFLQLRDKYKQELVEYTRLTKAADLAAKQHALLASDVPDAWKRPQLKAVGRQLRHWIKNSTPTVWCPGHWRACHGRPCHVPRRGRFWCWPVQAWLTQLVKTAEGIKQSASPGGPSRPDRKPPVPPKPSITLSAKKKLRFTLQVSTEELAQELPFSEASAPKLWDTPHLSRET